MKNGNNGNRRSGTGGVGIVLPNVVTHIVRTHAAGGKIRLPNTKMGEAFRKELRLKGVRV